MAKPKLAVEEVFILQEVLPYEGNEILGVFTTPEAAMEERPGRWTKVTNEHGTYWTTERLSERPMSPFLLVNGYPVRTK